MSHADDVSARSKSDRSNADRTKTDRSKADRSKTDRPKAGKPKTGLWKNIAALIIELWRAHPLATAAMALNVLASGATSGVYILATKGLIDGLTTLSGSTTALDGSNAQDLWRWVIVFTLTGVVEVTTNTTHPILSAYLRDHGIHRLQRRVLTRASDVPLIMFEMGDFYDLLKRAGDGVGGRLVNLFESLLDLLRRIVSMTSIVGVLFLLQPFYVAILVAGTIPALILRAKVATIVHEAHKAETPRTRLRDYLKSLLTDRHASAEVRIFGAAPHFTSRWSSLWDQRQQRILQAEGKRTAHHAAGDLISAVAYVGVVMGIGLTILEGQRSIGDFAAISQGAVWFQASLTTLFSNITGIQEQAAFLGDLFEFLDRSQVAPPSHESSIASSVQPIIRSAGRDTFNVRGDIADLDDATQQDGSGGHRLPRSGLALVAEHLTFSYPGSNRPVINGISLRIEPGEKVAIVGENGAGKSTLVKLLMGLYTPDDGTVSVEDTRSKRIPIEAATSDIAAVFQDYATYDLSLKENVGFGDLERLNDESGIVHALHQAEIDEIYSRLERDLSGYLGKTFGETDLSGGQWQRIALARAYFKDARILVLDEPTAALDPMAELALFERFAELAANRTAIMISHRLGMARLADRIIVLSNGTIAESGNHDELIAAKGIYARMFEAQAQWYRQSLDVG